MNHCKVFPPVIQSEQQEHSMTTYEIIIKLIGNLHTNPDVIGRIPVNDIIAAVYTEVYGLRQFYPAGRFDEIENTIVSYAGSLQQAVAGSDPASAISALEVLAASVRFLPDNSILQDFIEEAGFNRAKIRHITLKTSVVLGDSHVNFFSGNELLSFLPIGNEINTCEQVNNLPLTTLHLGPCIAYHCMTYGTTTRFYEKLTILKDSFIEKDARVILSMGEIDLRVHVFRESKKQNKPFQEITDNITENYICLLRELKSEGYDVICFGPVATQKDSHPPEEACPRTGTEQDRNRATAYFTERMRLLCRKENIPFVTVFEKMITDDYLTIEDVLSEDHVHLGQAALPLVLDAFQKNGIVF